jgi:NADH dehydrogenase
VTKTTVRLCDGRLIPAELVIWAAGIRAPDLMRDLDGLEINGMNQLCVGPTLQTTRDEDIFAIGDCAACPWPGSTHGWVPPRAQAAHQQASHLARALERRIEGRSLPLFRYRDFGSLVSLGQRSTVGHLMGGLLRGQLWVDGIFAWLMYVSLYQMHQAALHGWSRVLLDALGRWLSRGMRPRVKLH